MTTPRSNPNLQFPTSGKAPALAEFGPRVVTLCDGRSGLRDGITLDVRQPAGGPELANAPRAVLDFIASDATLDRYGELIEPSGWRLDNYRRNPVFQNAHQYGDIIFTLGRALLTEVREVSGRPALFQRIQFAVEVNPMARIAYGLYQGKFLNAVSVGFIPLRWENGEDSPATLNPQLSTSPKRRYLEQELLEVSAVGIPANPEALQLGLRAGAIQKSDLRELLDLLRSLLPPTDSQPSTLNSQPICQPGNPAGVETDTSALGVDANGAQLLGLARALRPLLGRN